MQVNVVITQTDTSGKKKTSTISHVNPQATNQNLLNLARSMNAFTTRIFVAAEKQTKGEVL